MNARTLLSTAVLSLATVAVIAAPAAGQVKSEKRIKVTKGPAEVRVDTVYRTDTIRTPGRTDTVTVTNTIVRVDTVQLAPAPLPALRLPTGLYFGLGGGVSAPAGALYNPNSAGPSGQAQLGWTGEWLGLRGDVNYAKPGEDAAYSGYQADPEVVNLNLDLTLNIPFLNHLFGYAPRFGVYALGGGSLTYYKNLPIRLNPGVAGGIGPVNVSAGDPSWQHNGGWNAGAGVNFQWAHANLFVESRLIAFHPDNTPQARQFNSEVGLNWFLF